MSKYEPLLEYDYSLQNVSSFSIIKIYLIKLIFSLCKQSNFQYIRKFSFSRFLICRSDYFSKPVL